ncbi:RNA-binding protein 26 [Podospora fimiseda]|uniref:RNA-binding protein 26 n=1 Tax=Podospora fimiseda TaxID=252190 RepID=A0AAN7H3K2_9PEZI|nr:RNA-binding protein 26 [Podospora fimiseda]
MLFPDEDAPELKKWIVKRLENNSDADADVLADYVMALLQHDGEVKAVRKLLEDEVPGFLQEGKDPTVFINDVFEAMEKRSYLPNAPLRPPKSQPHPREQKGQQKWQQQSHLMQQLNNGVFGGGAQQQQQGFALSYDDGPEMAHQQGQGRGYPLPPQSQAFPNGFSSGSSRKRGYQDLDNPNSQPFGGGFGGSNNSGRLIKQPRKGAPDGDRDSFPQAADASMGYYDPQAVATEFMRTLTQMNAQIGLPAPDFSMLNSIAGGRGKGKKRARCRDFDKKGYCPRGMNCNFQHTTDDLPPPPMPQQQPWGQSDEYDPTNALMTGMFPTPYHPDPFPPTANSFEGVGFEAFQQRQPRNQNNGGKRYTKRAAFSAEGPSYDKSNTSIVVEQIPEDNFEESQVRAFFSQFGNILEVSMQPYKRLAVVKFETWEEADAAYQSPKVIFENRFVRVYWYKEPTDDPKKKSIKNGFVKQEEGADEEEEEEGEVAEPIDMEELIKRQEEAQRIHEEKQKKLEELEKQRKEVEQKQAELLEKAARAKAELATKLARKNGTSGGDTNENGEQSHTKRTLAMLEDEARRLGLDPDAATVDHDDGAYHSPSSYDFPRGGYRGRGRGRGRGGYVPRGRGGYHRGGYAGDVHAAYAAYSLDNRPKKVVITGVDFTEGGRDEMLRQYLFGIGEFTAIISTSISTEIEFKDRKTAEKFYNLLMANGGVIPGVEGQVELAWASASGTPAPATPRTSNLAVTKREDQEEGEIDENEDGDHNDSDKDVRITLDRPVQAQAQQQQSRRVQDLDYEVADDEDGNWGY